MPTRAERPKIVYWDSCCFVSLIEGDPDRAPVLSTMADSAERNEIEIYTSILSIVEVAFAKTERDGRLLEEEVEAKIDRLWRPGSPFKLVELFPALAVRARDLMRHVIPTGGKIPKPADAIHLVTAERIGATLFHTYDGNLGKAETNLPFQLSIGEPTTDRIVWRDE